MVNIIHAFEDEPCGYGLEGKLKRTALLIGEQFHLNTGFPSLDDLQKAERARKFQALEMGHNSNRQIGYELLCAFCRACVPLRINTEKVEFSSGQKKLMGKNNKHLSIETKPARYSPEVFELYYKYIHARHRGSKMTEKKQQDLKNQIDNMSHIMLVRDRTGKLIAVALVDIHETAMKFEYLFYDPDESTNKTSLGTYCWLKLIEIAKQAGIKHLYTGSWAQNSPKLGYKSRFPGLETIEKGEWVDFDPEKHTQRPILQALATLIPGAFITVPPEYSKA